MASTCLLYVSQLSFQAHYNYNRILNCFASYTAGGLTIPPQLTIPQHTTSLRARKTCLINSYSDFHYLAFFVPTVDPDCYTADYFYQLLEALLRNASKTDKHLCQYLAHHHSSYLRRKERAVSSAINLASEQIGPILLHLAKI